MKKLIVKELYDKGYNRKEIIEQTSFNSSFISWALISYGIREREKRKFNKIVEITSFQHEVIIGKLLGDGYINNKKRLWFTQGEKQKDYVYHMYDIFHKNFKGSVKTGINKSHFIKGKYCKETIWYSYSSLTYKNIEYYYNLFYKHKKKRITSEIINEITPISIAYWYMDDGYYTENLKKRDKTIGLCTNSFSLEEVNLLCNLLKNKYKLQCRIVNYENSFLIQIKQKSIPHFIDLIKPYIIPSFYYKLGIK